MNAVGRAAQGMVLELERANIKVYMLKRMAVGPHEIVVFRRFTPAWAVRKVLRRMIEEGK